MIRRLFTGVAIVSLLLCAAACGLWARSHWRQDALDAGGRAWELRVGGGRFTFTTHAPAHSGRDFTWLAGPLDATLEPRPGGKRPSAGELAALGIGPALPPGAVVDIPPPHGSADEPYRLQFYPGLLHRWELLGLSGARGQAQMVPADDPDLWRFPRTFGTTNYWQVTVPFRLVTLAFAVPAAMVLLPRAARRFRARRRRRAGRCPACGYDLRGSAGRCPECGAGAD